MAYLVTEVGERRIAGNFKKQYFTASNGEEVKTGFIWLRNGEDLTINVGDIATGQFTWKDPSNPKYQGEYVYTGKFEAGGGSSKSTQGAVPSTNLTAKDIQITRQNACNVASNIMSGKGVDDIGKFWATVRQVQLYTSSGKVIRMSTKEQHTAILAMFGKDVDKARDAVEKSCGYPYIDAMTFDEAVSFLGIETPDLPS